MFVVFLQFAANKSEAGRLMDGHKEWIKNGFDDGVFLLVVSLQPNAGGGILAFNTSMEDLPRRVNDDPFGAENVVSAGIFEIGLARTDERLDFLST